MLAQRAVVFVPGFASTQEPGTAQSFLNILDTLGYNTFYVASQRHLPLTNNQQQQYPQVLWDQAVNVIEHMDTRRLQGTIGIGHSLGALILMIVATERPDLFCRLDLLCPADMQPQTFRQNARGFVRKVAKDIRQRGKREPDPVIRELTRQNISGSKQYFGDWVTFKRAWREAKALGQGLTAQLVRQWIAHGGTARILYIEHDLICPIAAEILSDQELKNTFIKLNIPSHDVHFWPEQLAAHYAPQTSA